MMNPIRPGWQYDRQMTTTYVHVLANQPVSGATNREWRREFVRLLRRRLHAGHVYISPRGHFYFLPYEENTR